MLHIRATVMPLLVIRILARQSLNRAPGTVKTSKPAVAVVARCSRLRKRMDHIEISTPQEIIDLCSDSGSVDGPDGGAPGNDPNDGPSDGVGSGGVGYFQYLIVEAMYGLQPDNPFDLFCRGLIRLLMIGNEQVSDAALGLVALREFRLTKVDINRLRPIGYWARRHLQTQPKNESRIVNLVRAIEDAAMNSIWTVTQ